MSIALLRQGQALLMKTPLFVRDDTSIATHQSMTFQQRWELPSPKHTGPLSTVGVR